MAEDGRYRLAVSVQHHPSRADAVGRLLAGLEGLRVSTVMDPDPTGSCAPWRTYERVLRECPTDATHLLTIQDDAVVLVPDIAARVLRAIGERPSEMISLYTGHYPQGTAIRAIQAVEAGQRWVLAEPHGSIFPTVALIWPTWRIAEALGFIDAAPWYAEKMADDQVLARWAFASHVPLWHVLPNPVDHPDDLPSLIPGQERKDYRRSCVPA